MKTFKKCVIPIQRKTIKVGDEVIDDCYREHWGLGKVIESKSHSIVVKFPNPKGVEKYVKSTAIKNLEVVYPAD